MRARDRGHACARTLKRKRAANGIQFVRSGACWRIHYDTTIDSPATLRRGDAPHSCAHARAHARLAQRGATEGTCLRRGWAPLVLRHTPATRGRDAVKRGPSARQRRRARCGLAGAGGAARRNILQMRAGPQPRPRLAWHAPVHAPRCPRTRLHDFLLLCRFGVVARLRAMRGVRPVGRTAPALPWTDAAPRDPQRLAASPRQ